MANDLIVAGPPDTNVGGYGSPGAAAYYGLQTEMLRRAALARQTQQDALDAQLKEQEIAASKENVETSRMQREAAAAANTERANKLGLEQATLGLNPGDALTSDQSAPILRFGGAGLVKQTPAMTAGVPTQFAQAPDAAAAPEVPTTAASTTYKGTADQQLLGQHRDYAQKIVSALQAKKDNGEDLTPLEQEQLYEGSAILMTGKSATAPAGVIVPKAAPAEKLANTYNALKQKQLLGQVPLTPEETASVQAYEVQHPTEATKQQDALGRINVTVTAADARQKAGFANKAVESDYNDLRSDYVKNVEPFLGRSVKAVDALNTPGGVNDVVAIPEFLSAMAGGQGSGLRMTQSELSMIQNARPGTESVWIKLKNLADNYTALTPEQRAQMKSLVQSVAQHQIARGMRYASAMDAMANSTSAVDSHKVRTDLMRTDLSDTTQSLGMPAAPGDETPDQRRARIRAAAGL